MNKEDNVHSAKLIVRINTSPTQAADPNTQTIETQVLPANSGYKTTLLPNLSELFN